jgi:hypothetical protein
MVVKEVVAKEAPQERALVESLDRFDDAQAVRLLKRRRRDPLGFGLSEAAALITPIVWIAVQELCRAAAEPAVAGLRRRARAAARRLRRRPAPEPIVPPLSAEDLDTLHSRIYQDAVTAGLAEEAARSLADRVKQQLQSQEPDRPEEPPEEP